jgi:L-aminopeptidase/D-esterase-like protein
MVRIYTPKSWIAHFYCLMLTTMSSYGISAAIGKTGAAIGTEVFTPIQTNLGKRKPILLSLLLSSTADHAISGWIHHRRHLRCRRRACDVVLCAKYQGDDLAIEDERFRAYLVTHGWDGEMGEEDEGFGG